MVALNLCQLSCLIAFFAIFYFIGVYVTYHIGAEKNRKPTQEAAFIFSIFGTGLLLLLTIYTSYVLYIKYSSLM